VQQYLGNKEVNPFAFHPSDAQVISGLEEGAVIRRLLCYYLFVLLLQIDSM
jgi:hypothetical protein